MDGVLKKINELMECTNAKFRGVYHEENDQCTLRWTYKNWSNMEFTYSNFGNNCGACSIHGLEIPVKDFEKLMPIFDEFLIKVMKIKKKAAAYYTIAVRDPDNLDSGRYQDDLGIHFEKLGWKRVNVVWENCNTPKKIITYIKVI